MRRARAGLLAAAWACAPAASAQDEPPPVAPPPYRELIGLAERGHAQAAIAEIGLYPAERTLDESRRVAADATCRRVCVQVAALIHTEAAFAARYAKGRGAEAAHVRAASSFVESLGPTWSAPEARDFERRWRLALGYGYEAWVRHGSAFDTYKRLLQRFPDDPETLVALGALLEQAMTAPAFFAFPTPATGEDANPAPYFERALAVRPDHLEARLRLGRVLGRQGHFDAARRELRQVLSREPPVIIEALAHLFLGDIALDRSAIDQAIDEYRAARRLEPRLQPAAVALAQALHSSGRRQQAATGLLEALRSTPRQPAWGWQSYHTDLLHGYRSAMDVLWRQARQ